MMHSPGHSNPACPLSTLLLDRGLLAGSQLGAAVAVAKAVAPRTAVLEGIGAYPETRDLDLLASRIEAVCRRLHTEAA